MAGRILSASVRRINKSILYVCASMRVYVCVSAQALEPTLGPGMSRTPRSLTARGKGPCCPMSKLVWWSQSFGEEINVLPSPGIKPRFFSRSYRSLLGIPTELSSPTTETQAIERPVILSRNISTKQYRRRFLVLLSLLF